MKKKVSKLEMKHNLEKSIEKNIEVLDTIQNWINSIKDKYKYNEDEVLKGYLETLEYIQFVFRFVDKQYCEAYKKLGGKKVFKYE